MELSPEVKKRQNIEKAVIRAFVKSALADGCEIAVHDGEDICLRRSTDQTKIMAAIMSTDEDKLYVYKDAKVIGWVFLVYGNDGWDVICDYTVNLEPLMVACNELSEKHERRAA
jgi:hypothetical protein